MDGVAYAAALALALVFAVAGIAKLRRRAGTARAFAALGLASPRVLAVGIPVVELGLAAGLVVVPAWASIVALAVLVGFTTFVVRAVRRGDRQGCGCFGATRPAPMGAAELVRNGVLGLAAAVSMFAPAPVVPSPWAVAVVAGASLAGVAAVSVVARRHRPSLGRRQGPDIGSPAPSLPGLDPDGTTVTLVGFVAPGCDGCAQLRATLVTLAHARSQRPGRDVVVVELADDSAPAFAAFGVRAPPFLVVVDGRGLVRAAGPARSRADVDDLLALALA